MQVKTTVKRNQLRNAVYLGLSIVLAIFMTVNPAFSQDEFIEINNDELGIHTRPIVVFPHEKHEEGLDCMDCHHEYDESGENIGGDGGSCSDCHTQNPGANPVPLMEAFHLQCKQCHAKEISSSENKNMPQMCGQCHVKNND